MSSDKDDADTRKRIIAMLDETKRIIAMLDETMKALDPSPGTMGQICARASQAAAHLAGDPVTPVNEVFWQIAGNLFPAANYMLDPTGPEVARLVELSKAIATTTYYEDWASSAAICQRLFDDIDGGEELGLSSDFLDVKDWYDDTQRTVALQCGMVFHRVPRVLRTAIADVIAALMLATPDSWVMSDDGHQLPQTWAMCCTYVVYAIAERVKHTEGERMPLYVPDGQHRHGMVG